MPANYVLLERITLTADAASVTFDNIPQTGYTDLVIKVSARGTQAAASNALTLRFNGSTTSYSGRELVADGSGVASATRGVFGSALYIGNIDGNSATSSTFGNAEIYIPNYTLSNNKSVSIDSVSENNASESYTTLLAGLWADNAAITSVDLISFASHGILMAGSSFSLYGVAKLGTTPVLAPKASGGDIVISDGTYWYHAFLSSGIFTPASNLTCDYLVVAGGGAGGEGYSTRTGGGGAGGLRSTLGTTGGGGSLESPVALTSAINYAIAIGAGASGGNGSNSSIAGTGLATIASIGGGGGTQASTGGTGGSGGGAGWPANGGAGTANQGFAGGNSSGGAPYAAGGGGGAGQAGQTAPNTSTGGFGGAGVSISAWATATGTGVSNFYAGGGGGGGSTPGAAGSGGGGAGSSGSAGTPGTANTGGGGGGQWGEGSSADGGSGIVILRYTIA
jgi:hypothetical protein